MKRHKPSKDKQEEDDLKEALAVLISSTHNRKRPLALTKIAHWLELAVAKLGTYSAVADRIGLSSKMLRQFSYVSRLSRPVQRLFDSRRLDSIDAVVHLAMLPMREQQTVARALASGEIDTADIRAVVQLRQSGQGGPIGSVLKRVRDSKAKHEYVAEFVVRGVPSHAAIERAFRRYIPSKEIVRLELNGALGRLVLTEEGNRAVAKAARSFRVPLKNVVSHILQGLKQA
jgi:hypothetical protein